jgi:UDP-N-acetylmuramate--alanine ligase
VGHDAANLAPGLDLVARSTAIPISNVEVRNATAGHPVLRRAGILAAIAATRATVAVAYHGKTTTSSMLALVLIEAGLRPSFIIGGDVNRSGPGPCGTLATFVIGPTRATAPSHCPARRWSCVGRSPGVLG